MNSITAIDVEQAGRPAKEWVYLLGLLLLTAILLLQNLKAKRAVEDLSNSAVGDAR